MFTSLSLNLTKQQQQKNTTNNNHLKIDQYINVQCKLKFLMALHNKKETVHYIFNCSTLC